MSLQTEIERKVGSRMSLASRAFLWLAALGIVGALVAFAYVQRWFTPTIDLYFFADTAAGLNRGMAVKLVGFNVGSLEGLSVVGELRVKGKVAMDRRYRDSIGKDSRIRLTKESLLGSYILVLVPGQGDAGPVTHGNVLTYEREMDYGAVVTGLVDRVGPVLDDVRTVTLRLADPEGNLQKAIAQLNEAAIALTDMGKELRQLAADGSGLIRSVPGRIDPVLDDARRSLARAESALQDVQRTLARTDGAVTRMDEALPGMIEDTRRSIQNARAATENLNRVLTEDVSRLVKRGSSVLDDTDELIGGVRRAWPVSGMLPQPAQKLIELDSSDGADNLTAGHAAPR
jgi:phospholipid/cholesterol/gamma-HCH transport system substrate-binding protein